MARRRVVVQGAHTVAPLAVALLSVVCVSVPRAPREADEAAKSFAAPPGKARIYLYRPRAWRTSDNTIAVDGKVVGVLAGGRYLTADVEPGCHSLFADWDITPTLSDGLCLGNATVKLDAARDTVYFVRVDKETKVSLVPDAAGRQGVAKCRLAGPHRGSRTCPMPPALELLSASGRVTDQAGNPLPGVHVTLELQAASPLYGYASMTREGLTDDSGLYSLKYEGEAKICDIQGYRLRFQKQGFRTWVHRGTGDSVVVVIDVRLRSE
jgi:Protein of unknown function (DUF2846)